MQVMSHTEDAVLLLLHEGRYIVVAPDQTRAFLLLGCVEPGRGFLHGRRQALED